jgi:uncharacterized protein with HEPN domain
MKPDDRVRLRHIVDALNSIIRFTAGRLRHDLDKDEMLAFALVHALQIVGEAAGKIRIEAREKNSQIPWAAIIGMRHRLVHAYVDIDLDLVWEQRRKTLPHSSYKSDRFLFRIDRVA